MKTRKLRPESSCQKPQSWQGADQGLKPNWAAPPSELLTLPTPGPSSSGCTSESHKWLPQEPCPDSDLTCQDTARTGLNALLSDDSAVQSRLRTNALVYNSSSMRASIGLPWRPHKNSGPTHPEFQNQQVWGGAGEFASLASSQWCWCCWPEDQCFGNCCSGSKSYCCS